MNRSLPFTDEHFNLRESIKRFIKNEIAEHYLKWEEEKIVPRWIWEKIGENGYLLPWAAEKYGGAGADFLYSVIIDEELAYPGFTSVFVPLHNDIVAPYIDSYGTEEQKQRWLPGCISGKKILAVAMTEPSAGSDLAAMKATARKDGKNWVLNGQKTFISNGILADIVVVAAKTGKPNDPPHKSLSLFVVERDAKGFARGEPIKKIGLKAQDTAELFFDDCVIPGENILGEEGKGFIYLMQKLQQERLICAIISQSSAEGCFEITRTYAKERSVFGKPLAQFQNTQFVLAQMATEIAVGRSFVDELIKWHMEKKDILKETSMAKLWVCEMFKRIADQCLQIFGGYGYCVEYPVSRYYVDSRIQTIFAGTSEVMKLIISRSLDL